MPRGFTQRPTEIPHAVASQFPTPGTGDASVDARLVAAPSGRAGARGGPVTAAADAPRPGGILPPAFTPVGNDPLTRRARSTGGDLWTVWERDASEDAGARAPTCLVFDREGVRRRVWRYPPDWRALPDAALLALADIA